MPGFIGSHTARALLDAGVPCVLTSHRSAARPEFLADIGDRAVVISLDVRDRDAVLALGRTHAIDGIVHLGGALSADLFAELRDAMTALANILEAAATWKVKRLVLAGAIGVYGVASGEAPMREEAIIPLRGASNPIVAMKKATEIYAESVATRAGIECVVALDQTRIRRQDDKSHRHATTEHDRYVRTAVGGR